jgi:hypothetical protein
MSDPVDMAEWVKQSRAAQGLPPKVTDPATLAKIVRLLRSTAPRVADAA